MGKFLREFKTVSLTVLFAFLFAGVFSCGAQTLGEGLDATNLVWMTGGDALWFAQTTNTHDGIDAVSSGFVDSNQTNWIETTIVGPATVSYWIRAQSQGFSSVISRFTVNENSGAPIVPSRFVESSWQNKIYDLGAGTNVLRWSVSNTTSNEDFVILDEFSVAPPRPLAIEDQPTDETVFFGASAFFAVSAIGTPPFHYQWHKDGTNIADVTNSWYYLANTSTNDSGVYSVTVSNAQNFLLSSNVLLTVLPPSAPFFTFHPESSTVYTGQDFNFWSGVDGSPPFTHQWRKDGTNLPNATLENLVLTNVSLADAGRYTLVVSNDFGSVESSNVVLTVIQSVAPVFTRNPRSLEVAAGVSTWLSAAATGLPGPCLMWKKVGDDPPPSFPPLPIPCAQPCHSLANVTSNNSGIYFVSAINAAGEVVSPEALLTVLPPLSIKGSCDLAAENIFVTNGLAFLARGTNGVTILSVSNASSPQFLANYDTPGNASAVQVSGDLAFVADGSAGLQILNVAEPNNPVFVGCYNTAGTARDVVVRSNLAFVADGDVGLLILDISNPSSPATVGSYSTNLSPSHLCLSKNLIFASSTTPRIVIGSNWVGGTLIIDISDASQPVELSRLGAGTVDARDQLVFAAGQVLETLSVSNAAQPNVIGYFFSGRRTSFNDAQVRGDLLYLLDNSDDQTHLTVLNVRDPTEPIPVGTFTMPGQSSTLFVEGNHVYITGENFPLQIIETPFNTQPIVRPSLSITRQNGLRLQIRCQRGLNFTIEQSDELTGFPWLPSQTILLTNENSIITLPAPTETKFFRLRQLD